MTFFALFLGGLFITAADPAPSAVAATGTAPSTAPAADPLKGKICRRYEMTGTILRSKRVCMSAEKWREQDARVAADTKQRKESLFGGGQCNHGAVRGC